MNSITAIALTSSPVWAEVWGVAPRASFGVRFDHNTQLAAATVSQSQIGGSGSLGARIVGYGATTDWSLDPQVTLVRYAEQQNLDRDEIQVNGSASTRFELAEWQNLAIYDRDTTITSERGATGLTQSNLPHEHVGVTTMPSVRFAERWSLGGTASWSADRYDDAQSIGLVNYDYLSAGGQIRYSISERTSVSFDTSFGELLIPSLHRTKNQYAGNLRVESTLNELWRLSSSGGLLRVVSDELTESGFGYALKVERRAETSGIAINASRDVVPSGRGSLSQRDQASIVLSRNLSSRLATDVSAQWLRSKEAVPSLDLQFGAVSYSGIEAALRWQAAPTVSIALSIGGGRQDQEQIASAETYHAFLTLVWQGLERGH